MTVPLVAAIASAAAGCNGILSQREVVVHFAPGTSESVRATVLQQCGGFPQVSPEPLPTSTRDPATRLGQVRFRVDDADNRQLSRLLACLQGFPQVQGYDLPQEGI
jgi:hypothetical protein